MKKLLFLITVILTYCGTSAQVAVYWRGEATNGNWENGSSCDGGSDGNWYYATWGGNRKRPDCYANHYIHFDNNNQTNMLLNAGADFNIGQILFDASATSPRTINATDYRKLQFNASPSKVENYSAANHTFNAEFVLNNTTEINPINGNLTVNGSIYTNGNTLNIYGNNGKNLNIGAPVSGSGNVYVKQNTIVTLSAQNTYTGITQVEAGTLILNNDAGALPSGASVTVMSGGVLKISKNQTLANVSIQSGGTLVIDANTTLTISNSYYNAGSLQKNGTLILLMTDTVYWRQEATNGSWDWGDSCDNSTNGNWYYASWGGNRKRPDCYGGKFVHIDNNTQPAMELNSTDDFSVLQLIFDTGASAAHSLSSPVGRKIYFKPGAISKIENYSAVTHTVNTAINLENDLEINPIDGDLTLTNTIENNGYSISVYGNNSKTLTISGAISGNGGIAIKQNSVVTLSAENTYTGSTIVEAGTLVLNNSNGALPSNASVTLISGATLIVSKDQTLSSLTLPTGATLIIDAEATLTITGTPLTTGTLVNNGTLKLQIANTGYSFPSGLVVSNLHHLEISAGNVTLNQSLSPENLTISGGELDVNAFSINSTSNNGTLALTAGALKIGGTATLPSGYTTYSILENTTVEYYGSAQQIAVPGNQKYGYLILSGTGEKSIANNITIAHDLTLNGDTSLRISSGKSITIDDRLINNNGASALKIEDNAALVQTNNVTNTGEILQFKNSNNLYRLDYTIWASPVAGQNLLDFSPQTIASRFYEYRYGTNSTGTSLSAYFHVNAEETDFTAGKGYLIRMPNAIDDVSGYNAGTTRVVYGGIFLGEPHNGTVTIPVSTQGDRYTSIGNPYPSPISVAEFFTQNSTVLDENGAIYLWRKRNGDGTSSYATLTLAAFTANGGGTNSGAYTGGQNAAGYFTGNSNNWVLAPGQGFLVQTRTDAPPQPNITFTNSMRRVVPAAGQAFLRAADNNTDRYWININDANGGFSQAAIVYMEGATNNIDFALDGLRFSENQITDLFSISNNKQLAIQAKPSFTESDTVTLGFMAPTAGNYSISIDRTEGIFNQIQTIYLYDRLEGVIRNLSSGSYNFTSESGTFNDRFEIHYTTTVLNTDSIEKPYATIYKSSGNLAIELTNAELMNVDVYDTNGRCIYKTPLSGQNALLNLQNVAHQVLIMKLTTSNGIISKKIIY